MNKMESQELREWDFWLRNWSRKRDFWCRAESLLRKPGRLYDDNLLNRVCKREVDEEMWRKFFEAECFERRYVSCAEVEAISRRPKRERWDLAKQAIQRGLAAAVRESNRAAGLHITAIVPVSMLGEVSA